MESNSYSITIKGKKFKLVISEQAQGYFVGTVIWYSKSGDWETNTICLDLKVEHFLDNSNQDVYVKAITWITKNIGKPDNVDKI